MSIAITNTDHYSNIADSVRYSKDAAAYESSLARAKAERDSIIDGSITSIESDVTNIRAQSFSNCTNLTSVSLPNVTSIGNYAFQGCTNLSIVILRKRATLLNLNAFSDADNAIIYVQPEDLSWYSTATNWSTLYAQDRIKSIEDLTGDDLAWYQEQLARYQEVS